MTAFPFLHCYANDFASTGSFPAYARVGVRPWSRALVLFAYLGLTLNFISILAGIKVCLSPVPIQEDDDLQFVAVSRQCFRPHCMQSQEATHREAAKSVTIASQLLSTVAYKRFWQDVTFT